MLIKTWYNRDKHPKPGEISTTPSKTIPDQSISIPEMIRRYASGMPLGGQRIPQYSDDPETDVLGGRNWQSMDISEHHDLIESIKQEYNETIQNLRNYQPSSQETIQAEQPHTIKETN